MDREVFTINGTHPWLIVTQVFRIGNKVIVPNSILPVETLGSVASKKSWKEPQALSLVYQISLEIYEAVERGHLWMRCHVYKQWIKWLKSDTKGWDVASRNPWFCSFREILKGTTSSRSGISDRIIWSSRPRYWYYQHCNIYNTSITSIIILQYWKYQYCNTVQY